MVPACPYLRQSSDLCLVAWHHYHFSHKIDSLTWHWRYYWNPISDISQRKCALPWDFSMLALIYGCSILPITHKARLQVECIIVKQEVILALVTWLCIIFSTLCPIPTKRNVVSCTAVCLWLQHFVLSDLKNLHYQMTDSFILTLWMLTCKSILFLLIVIPYEFTFKIVCMWSDAKCGAFKKWSLTKRSVWGANIILLLLIILGMYGLNDNEVCS